MNPIEYQELAFAHLKNILNAEGNQKIPWKKSPKSSSFSVAKRWERGGSFRNVIFLGTHLQKPETLKIPDGSVVMYEF